MGKIDIIRKSLFLAFAGTLALFALGGCSSDEPEEPEIQEAQTILGKLDAIQAQVKTIEADVKELVSDDQPQIILAGVKSVQQFSKQLDDLEKRVNEAAIATDSVAVPENADERPVTYFEAITPLEELRVDLELIEDAFITAHGKGTVKSDELWLLEAQKGEIEDMISLAEDSLRFRMAAE